MDVSPRGSYAEGGESIGPTVASTAFSSNFTRSVPMVDFAAPPCLNSDAAPAVVNRRDQEFATDMAATAQN